MPIELNQENGPGQRAAWIIHPAALVRNAAGAADGLRVLPAALSGMPRPVMQRSRPTTDVATSGWPRHGVLLGLVVALVAFNLRPAVASVGPVLPEARADLSLSGVGAAFLTFLPVLCSGCSRWPRRGWPAARASSRCCWGCS